MVAQIVKTATGGENDAFIEVHKLDRAGRLAFLLDGHEVDSVIELTAEVPGVAGSDIEVNLDGNIMTIIVEKRPHSDGKQKHFSERLYGHFQRSIQLPFAPDEGRVTGDLENGVLTLRVPRKETGRRRRIAIGEREPEPETLRERGAIGAVWADKAPSYGTLTLTEVVGTSPARVIPPPPPPKLPGAS